VSPRAARRLALGLALAWTGAAGAGEPPPNVVLVTLDTTRADHLGAWGHPHARTPRLDALAARGRRYARCDTAAPVTLPAHATILTGLFPPRHGVRDNGTFALAAGIETVAERFAAAGRDTAAVVSAVVLARRHGLDQGFRRYDDDLGAGYAQGTQVGERPADAVTAAALAALADLRPPFFLWVHYFDPHEEYRPPARFADAATGPHRLYDGEIGFLDEEVGRLFDALPPATAVVVVGDHGEMLGERGEATHGLLLAPGARRVPLLLAGPGIAPGETVDCLVATADVAPTLLELGRLAPPAGLDGRSLLVPDRGCGGTSYAESFLPFFAYKWYPLRALSDGRALYLQAPQPALYALDADPAEERDLAAAEPALVALWRGRLERLLAAAGERLDAAFEGGSALDRAQVEQLAALGYLAGGAGGAVSDALPDPRARVELARRLHEAAAKVQQGLCAEVLRELDALVDADPRNFPALCLAGECLRDAGRNERAIDLFRRAAQENPRSPVPPANLGAALLALGQVEEGERELRRALALDPTDGVSAARLARSLESRGRAAEALALLDAARSAGSRLPDLFVERGTLLAAAGRVEEALADFREAAKRDPQSAEAAENVARALYQLGRAKEALFAYQALLRLAPARLDVWKTVGALALAADEPGTALEAFRAALRLETDAAERAALEAVIAELTSAP
jgi:arylsulfatase A-like enzyme/DNA-binding SARP family transcriptional activator